MKLPTTVKAAGALLWKNFTVKRRHPFQIIVEIFIPLMIVAILMAIRTRNLKTRYSPCYVHEKSQDSVSPLMFARDFVCFYNTTCSEYPYIDWNSTNLPEISWAEFVSNLTEVQRDIDFNFAEAIINPASVIEKNRLVIEKLAATMANGNKYLQELQELFKMINDIRNGTATDETYKNVSMLVCGTDRSDLKKILSILTPTPEASNVKRVKRETAKSIANTTIPLSRVEQCRADAKNILGNNPIFKRILKFLEPMLWGKIYYTDGENPFVDQVIKRANLTFHTLDNLRLAAVEWRERYRDYLSYTLTKSTQATSARTALSTCQTLATTEQTKQQCGNLYEATDPVQINSYLDMISQLFLIIEQALNCVQLDKYQPLPSNMTMNDLKDSEILEAYAGIEFDPIINDGKTPYNPPKLLAYNLRMSKSKIDGTVRYKVLDQFWTPYPRNNPLSDIKYYMSGFLNLQQALSDAYISVLTKPNHNITKSPTAGSSVGTSIQIMPYPCYVIDNFIRFLGGVMPLLIIISWIGTFCFLVKSVVAERESGTRQYMHILGVSRFNSWFSWMVSSKIQTTISCILMTMCISLGSVLQFSSPYVTFIILFAYCWSFICQAFLVSTIFTNANIAGVVAGVIYFILYLPYIVVVQQEDQLTLSSYYGLSLSSQVSLCLTLRYIANWEQTTQGLTFSNLFTNVSLDMNFSVGHCLMMMILDGVIYLILMAYIDNVFPGKYGVPLPFYYPFLPNYWRGGHIAPREPLTWSRLLACCRRRKTKAKKRKEQQLGITTVTDNDSRTKDNMYENVHSQHQDTDSEKNPYYSKGVIGKVEPLADNLPVGISINNLTKTYGSLNAVDGLTVDFYQGQITAFLGHNGAGKTTTISILTGMIPATSGEVLINGVAVGCGKINESGKSGSDTINVGLCPQHNVLFPDLTAAEHVMLYSRIRGFSIKAAKSIVDKVLEDVGLLQRGYKYTKAGALSGGYKRKLSVALAFLGNVKVVFLDEPTAGVDPFARRGIWEMLLKYKQQDRTIILTTHHMDEADFLSDRIAIIARGKLCCIGSSVFLKRQYGEGYFLHLERVVDHLDVPKCDPNAPNKPIEKVQGNNKEAKKSAYMLEYLKQFVPNVRLVEERRTEWVFVLPYQNQSVEFIKLLKDLEGRKLEWEQLGFVTFGITDTTLEEVFLKVVKLTEKKTNESGFNSPRLIEHSPVTNSTAESNDSESDNDSEIDEDEYDKTIELDNADLPVSINNARILERCGNSDILDMKNYPSVTGNQNNSIGSIHSGDLQEEDLLENVQILTGVSLLNQHMRALLLKRWYFSKRSIKGMIAELILPILMMLLMIGVITKSAQQPLEQPRMTIQPWMMVGKSLNMRTFFRSEYPGDYSPDNVSEVYKRMIELDKNMTKLYPQPAIEAGIRCMLPTHAAPGTAEPPIPTCQYSSAKSAPGPFPYRPYSDSVPLVTPDCDCNTTGNPICSAAAGSPVSMLKQTLTSGSGDILMDLSKYNVSDHLLKKFYKYRGVLYGGLQFLLPSQLGIQFRAFSPLFPTNLSNLNSNASGFVQHMGYFTRSTSLKTSYTRVWVNTKGYLSMPAYLNILDNLLLRTQLRLNTTSSSQPSESYGIMVSSYPFKYSTEDLLSQLNSRIAIELSVATFTSLALSLIPASFVLFQVEERVTNSKHLQFVSGVSPYVYWVAMFIWDIFKFIIPLAMILCIFVGFDYQSYIGSANLIPFILLLLFYSCTIIVHMYPFAFLFSVPSSAFVVMYSYNVLIGSITTITTFIIDTLSDSDVTLKPINLILKKVFLVFPQYSLGRGMMDLSTNYMKANFSDGLIKYDPYEWQYTSEKLVALTVLFVCWWTVLFLMESGIIDQKLVASIRNYSFRHKLMDDDDNVEEDEDVTTEKFTVKSKAGDKFNLKVQDLTKIYSSKLECPKCDRKIYDKKKGKSHNPENEDSVKRRIAVNGISFGVMPDECFGLLGINGAGKTTTFKMLTGAENMTRGYAYICGVNVTEGSEAYKSLGYCPQFDALHSLLNVEEELRLFCLFRGIPYGTATERIIEKSVDQLNLNNHRYKLTSALSGGNKRKLSTALALIGSPKVIFLDEPTAGMDAAARRFLWTRIQELTRSGACRSVVLTSHNMEECEVLCHRLAIMVDGHIKCLGSIQHLKSKYGGDYQVNIRLHSSDVVKSCEIVKFEVYNTLYRYYLEQKGEYLPEHSKDSYTNFPDTSPIQLAEETSFSITYRIEPIEFKGLAIIFEFFDRLKRNAHISDFSISQTTLDEIFVNFAAKQKKSSELLSVARNSVRREKDTDIVEEKKYNPIDGNNLVKSKFERKHDNEVFSHLEEANEAVC